MALANYKWIETASYNELEITDVPYTMLMLRVLVGVHSTDMLLLSAMRLGKYQPTAVNRVLFLKALTRLMREGYVRCHKDTVGERHWEITPRGAYAVQTGGDRRGDNMRKKKPVRAS